MVEIASLSFVRQREQDCSAESRRYCVFSDGQLVTRKDDQGLLIVWFSAEELKIQFNVSSGLNIGHTEKYTLFAVQINASEQEFPEPYQATSLINFMLHEREESAQLVGRAAQLLSWQETNQYCGKCGGAMKDTLVEYAMACESCGTTVYPRVSPCIITLVTDQDRMLLATNKQTHGKWYSTLAGFVEAGESLEEALHREVYEEVGVKVKNIQYFSSQPWPFPAQLMVGFFAEYAGGEITPDGVEIEHAEWFDAHDLPQVPGKFSIAGKLIQHFISTHAK